jgi:APA family basic amino acid/polyamine antiporter
MLGAGAAMGVSVFSVLAPAARIAGSGILISAFIAAVPMVVFAWIYAFMTSILPKSGASYEWPRRFVSPFVGFMVAWLRILASVGVLVTLALVFVQYLATVLVLPTRPTMMCLLLIVLGVNLRGIHISARAQSAAMLLLVATLCGFVCFSGSSVRLERIGNPFIHGVGPILAAVPLMISLYLGIETATEVGEEVRNAPVVIPRALAIALFISLTMFAALAFVCLGILGPGPLAETQAPLITAGRVGLGRWAEPVILFASALSILKSLNALFIVFSRYLFAMARAGALPAPMATIHPRWGTPYVAIYVAFGCTLVGLFMPVDLVFLFVAFSIPTVLKYLSTSTCAFIVATKQPDLAATTRLGLSRSAVVVLSLAGIGCALVILLLGGGTDWRPYGLIGVWGLLGACYWRMRAAHLQNAPAS